jgi:hypothetical protein
MEQFVLLNSLNKTYRWQHLKSTRMTFLLKQIERDSSVASLTLIKQNYKYLGMHKNDKLQLLASLNFSEVVLEF